MWILDSGASTHISFQKELFVSLEPVTGISVSLLNHTRIFVDFVGDVHISADLVLRRVMFIPSFRFNLISISSLTSKLSYTVQFAENSCLIQDKSFSKTIGKAKLWQGLYLLTTSDCQEVSVASVSHSIEDLNKFVSCSNVACKSLHVWHSRLGHPSSKCLEALKKYVSNKKFSTTCNAPCLVCPLAKQHRLSFNSSNHFATKTFDVLHCDIWGPYPSLTHSGHKYFLTLVDDHSRYTWIYLLKQKSDVLSTVPRFLKLIETQYNASIKTFRSDNAPELSFTELFQSKGIIHQYSCVACPEQNSVVERKHQHLLNVA